MKIENAMEEIDQKFFISNNPDRDYNYLFDSDGYLWNLLTMDCNVMDEKGNEYVLPSIPRYYSLDEWKVTKAKLFEKIEQLKKYTKLWIDSIIEAVDYASSDEPAQEYWDDMDDDDYPKSEYETIDDWKESQGYWEWVSQRESDDIDYVNGDFPEFGKHIDRDYYYDTSRGGSYYYHGIERYLNEMEKDAKSMVADMDEEFSKNINEHKYDAIIYALEEL